MKERLENADYELCPICGKEKFYRDNYFIFCNTCGWEGNLGNDDNFIELNGYSARDYRKIYQEFIKINPNYIWKKDKKGLDNYINSFKEYGSKCPVCNEDSMEPNYRYCYKCGWKYNFIQAQFSDFGNSSNKLSLNEYKEQYNNIIESNPKYLWKDTDEVNLPFNNEQIEWLKVNNISKLDKLTSEEEMHKILGNIEKIQSRYETKDGYEEYMFIKSIIDIILDNIN